MTLVFAMTLPGLVVLLTIATAVNFAIARRRARHAPNAQSLPVASAGFDILGMTLAPAIRHRLQHDASRRMRPMTHCRSERRQECLHHIVAPERL